VADRLDLENLVRKMSHLFKVSVPKRAVLKYDIDHSAPAIEADEGQIQQVVMNLVSNAAEAIDDTGGVITIRVGSRECTSEDLSSLDLTEELPAGSYTFVEVVDDGEGMTEEVQGRMFEPFYSTRFTGRGLGLAAVHGIVRGHKGTLEVSSSPGKGTSVRALFPAAAFEPSTHEASSGEDALDAPKGTVLVIDDEEAVRSVAERMLGRLGYRALTASDGQGGLELFNAKKDEIDCVLLDFNMAGLDGKLCFERLRSIRDDICVIFTSGLSESDILSDISCEGRVVFLQKPFRVKGLARALESTISKSTDL
jgi:CheY-like chemotaxis protein